MTRPLRIEYPGACYHVMSRGNEKKPIFINNGDRKKFLKILHRAFVKFGFWIHAYVLMGNHYHLFIETPNGNLSRILHYINSCYTLHFNYTHKRVGHLLQGRYKAILVQAESYALVLARYIHLNPVRAGLTRHPEDYPWSSCRVYVLGTQEPAFLNTSQILNQFSGPTPLARRKFLTFTKAGSGEEGSWEKNIWPGSVLGNETFIEWVKRKFLKRDSTMSSDEELPLLKKGLQPIDANTIRRLVGTDKKLYAYFLRKYSHLKLKEVAALVGGYHPSNITKIEQKVESTISKNRTYKERVENLEAQLFSNFKV